MKKTLLLILALASIPLAYANTALRVYAGADNAVTLDTSVTDYQLNFDTASTANQSFYVNTTGKQTVATVDGYGLDNLSTATINFTLADTLTITGEWGKGKFKDGITLNYNLGSTASVVSENCAISLVGYNSTMNLSTSTTQEQLNTAVNNIYTRDLVTVGNNMSIWYSVTDSTPRQTTITLSDSYLAANGYEYIGAITYSTDGSQYTTLDGTAVTLKENQYALLLSRTDNKVTNGNAAEKAQLLVMTPEPATATLSLLALAGLAARRRRH